jgi:heavy metal translocating P-type ATPase
MTRPTIREAASIVVAQILLPLTLASLVLGLVLSWSGADAAAFWVWTIPAALVGARLALSIARDLLAREAGVDVIALLAIGGAIALGEALAASVIALMLATGEALESFAEGRAQRELSALLGRAPKDVRRFVNGGLETVPIEAVRAGDRLLVRPGEVVPVDGIVRGGAAALDESALTGESRVVTREEGETVSSGVVNAGGAFDLHAIATAEGSTYAGIVRLVEAVGRSKAPFVRLADRYALLFIPLTLAMSGAAWLLTGDPVRALQVLVVATPCPLLLAAPIAIVAGISRAARRGIIVKGGGPLETLARASVLLFDKTGTLTVGRPQLASIEGTTDVDEVLRLAAALEQASPHVLAAAIVAAARERRLALPLPSEVDEVAGGGIRGIVERRAVTVGSAAFVSAGLAMPAWARELRRRSALEGTTNVFVGVDGTVAAAFVLEDPIRSDTPRAVRSLRKSGFSRILMVTGDHHGVAELVGAAIGLDGVLADRAPSEKVDVVVEERRLAGGPLVMVGDGINDAPALSVADVGVAMGARGATASSEAADIVITVDRLDRLAEAVAIARHSRSIAVQSILLGMGLSLVAMAVAMTGYLPVVAGAMLQEAIDVVAILNALRALRGGVERPVKIPGWVETHARLASEHRDLAPGIARVRRVADALDAVSPSAAMTELRETRRFLADQLIRHEMEEDREVYPHLAAALGSDDATAALHVTHAEFFHLIRVFGRLVDVLPADGPAAEDWPDLRRVLYGLDAILRLHMAQEEELYASVGGEESAELEPIAA